MSSESETDFEEFAARSADSIRAYHVAHRDGDVAMCRKWRRSERNGYQRWVLLIKELRVTHDVSLLEAERLALTSRHRSKWLEWAINSNRSCRKHAEMHIRHNGEASLIRHDGKAFRVDVG